MMMIRMVGAMTLVVCLLAGGAWADTILLKNGAVFEGKIIEESDTQVGLKISFGEGKDSFIEKYFPRARIKRITRGAARVRTPQQKSITVEAPKKARSNTLPDDLFKGGDDKERESLFGGKTPKKDDAEKSADAAKEAGAKDKEMPDQPQIDDALRMQLEGYVAGLGSTETAQREAAKARLSALGKEAMPVLVKSLGMAAFYQRISMIELMGAIKDKRTVQVLIGELKGPRTQYLRTNAAYEALKSVTGKSLPFDGKGDFDARTSAIKGWDDWFESVMKNDEYFEQFDSTGTLRFTDDPDKAPGAPTSKKMQDLKKYRERRKQAEDAKDKTTAY
jgi:hypothetical protein